MTTDEARDTAQQILNIIPLVMRMMGAEMRHNSHIQEPSQFGLLKMLARRSWNLSEMAEKHCVSLPTMSKSIRRLEEHKWVKLRRAEDDRRIVWVEMTPAGRAVLDEVEEQTLRRVEKLVITLPPEERATLSAGLAILRDMFQGELQTEHHFLHHQISQFERVDPLTHDS